MANRWIVKEYKFQADVSDIWPENRVFLIQDTVKKHCLAGLRFEEEEKAQKMCDTMNARERAIDKMFKKEIQKFDVPCYDRTPMSNSEIMLCTGGRRKDA